MLIDPYGNGQLPIANSHRLVEQITFHSTVRTMLWEELHPLGRSSFHIMRGDVAPRICAQQQRQIRL